MTTVNSCQGSRPVLSMSSLRLSSLLLEAPSVRLVSFPSSLSYPVFNESWPTTLCIQRNLVIMSSLGRGRCEKTAVSIGQVILLTYLISTLDNLSPTNIKNAEVIFCVVTLTYIHIGHEPDLEKCGCCNIASTTTQNAIQATRPSSTKALYNHHIHNPSGRP